MSLFHKRRPERTPEPEPEYDYQRERELVAAGDVGRLFSHMKGREVFGLYEMVFSVAYSVARAAIIEHENRALREAQEGSE